MEKFFDNKEEAIDFVKENMKVFDRRRFGVVCQQEEGFYSLVGDNQPCWGGIRKYKEDSVNATQPDDKPGDLYFKFPEGSPIYLMLSFSKNLTWNQELSDYLIGNKSPWKKGFVTGKVNFK